MEQGRNYRNFIPPIVLAIVAVTWGASYVVVKDLLVHVSVAAYLTLRFLFSLPIVVGTFRRPLADYNRTFRNGGNRDYRQLTSIALAGLVLFLAFVLQSEGLRGTEPGVAAFLTSLVFLFVPIIEWLNEKFVRRQLLLPGLLALAGVLLLTQPWTQQSNGASSGLVRQVAQCLVLCSAIAYSLHIYLTGKVARSVHPAVIFTVQGVVVLFCATSWLLSTTVGSLSAIGLLDLYRALFLAFVVTAACYLAQFWAQKTVRPRHVGLIYTLEPVAAMVAGVLTRSQPITSTIVTGAILTTAAAVLTVLISSSHQDEPSPPAEAAKVVT